MMMEPIFGPEDEPEGIFENLWDGLATIARINLTFSLVMLGSAIAIRSVSLAAASLAIFEEGAIHALLMAALTLRPIDRLRVATGLTLVQLGPAAGFFWCMVNDIHSPTMPPPNWIALLGGIALVISIIDALVTARFRASPRGLFAAMSPSLRANAPTGISLILVAILIAGRHWVWTDMLFGVLLAATRFGAPRLLIDIGRFPLQESVSTFGSVRRLIQDHPRLAILQSWVWQCVAASPWAKRRATPFGNARRHRSGGPR